MHIFSASRINGRTAGYVADFCQACLEPRHFRISRFDVNSQAHYLMDCQVCSLRVTADLSSYLTVQKTPAADLNDAIDATFPELAEQRNELFEAARPIRSGMLDARGRVRWFNEVIRLFDPMVEFRSAFRTDFDRRSCSGCMLTLLIFLVLFVVSATVGKEHPHVWLGAAFAALVIGLIISVGLAVSGAAYFVKQRVLPGIALTLAPHHPTEDEIQTAINTAAALKMSIARHLKAPDLMSRIEKRLHSVTH